MRIRRLYYLPLTALLLICCADADPRFSTPAMTFRTYRSALAEGDAQTSWMCLSNSFRELEFNNSTVRWSTELQQSRGNLAAAVDRLEIIKETVINERLAYLQFDESTVGPASAPFYYFLRESEGWRITTHLDSLFRGELEAAIVRGEFELPGTGH